MKSRNWQGWRKHLEAVYGVPCSLKPSQFIKPNPWDDIPAPPPRAESPMGSIVQACKELIGDLPIPKPELSPEEEAKQRERLDKHRDLMRRSRAEKRGFASQGGRTKMSRYYRKITGRHEI